jgi:hypothetical protein
MSIRLADATQCVAFHSQHKSAGMTFHTSILDAAGLKSHLRGQPSPEVLNCDVGLDGYGAIGRRSYRQGEQRWDFRTRLFVPHKTSLKSCAPPGCSRNASDDEHVRILYNGYTLAMAEQPSFSHARCTWLTAFREPTSRLLSSFYYCHGAMTGLDPLCGAPFVSVAKQLPYTIDGVRAWARFWGNYMMRELLMFPPLLRAAIPTPLPPMPSHSAVWYRIHKALNGSGT